MEEELSLYEATAEEQMQNAITHLDETLSHIRAGKASPKLLDTIRIDYYGTQSPLSSVATVLVPDARTIAIQPQDSNLAFMEMAAAGATLYTLDDWLETHA